MKMFFEVDELSSLRIYVIWDEKLGIFLSQTFPLIKKSFKQRLETSKALNSVNSAEN